MGTMAAADTNITDRLLKLATAKSPGIPGLFILLFFIKITLKGDSVCQFFTFVIGIFYC
jgi:hypothetical protein